MYLYLYKFVFVYLVFEFPVTRCLNVVGAFYTEPIFTISNICWPINKGGDQPDQQNIWTWSQTPHPTHTYLKFGTQKGDCLKKGYFPWYHFSRSGLKLTHPPTFHIPLSKPFKVHFVLWNEEQKCVVDQFPVWGTVSLYGQAILKSNNCIKPAWLCIHTCD